MRFCAGRTVHQRGVSGTLSMLALQLYLDQNYLSGFAKDKPAFRELLPVLQAAVSAGAVAVLE